MSETSPQDYLDTDLIATLPEGPLGVAVSGGSDSTALLHLLHKWGKRHLIAATVDHKLRFESTEEAKKVFQLCETLGVPHEILDWHADDKTSGNLQNNAREARRALLSEWALRHGIRSIVLGHTKDDQAETVLLRLLRGSGVDGLAAIPKVSEWGDFQWVHPLLATSRQELRDYLVRRNITWCDDPSNDDPKFARVKARHVIAELGLDQDMLVNTATRMRMAGNVLNEAAFSLAQECASAELLGYIDLDPLAYGQGADETRLRLLAHILNWVSGAQYRPRFSELRSLCDAICRGCLDGGRTLHGCVIRQKNGSIHICRELGRTGQKVPAGQIWDRRWRSANLPEYAVGALGQEGALQHPEWRDSGAPRDAILSSPAIWSGKTLISTFFTSNSKEFGLQLVHPSENCFTSLQGC